MVVTLLVLLCLFNLSCGQTTNCTRILDTSGSGKVYNLAAIEGRELTWKDAFSNYKATICKNNYTTCGRCGPPPAGFCQYTDQWADCVGKFSIGVGMDNGTGVELLYDGGDWGNVGRIRILCDPNVELSEPTVITNAKYIQVFSKHACLSLPPPVSGCGNIPDPSGSGAFYNLSPLTGQQIFWAQPSTNYNFKATICNNSYVDCGKCQKSGMCRYNSQFNECLGKFQMAVGTEDEQGVYLFYEDGDFGNEGRIKIVCDPNVVLSTPTYDTNPQYVTVRSKYGCLCQWVCVPPY
jgi:hypothetical protein